MDKDALIRRLMKTFLAELDEHVQALDRGLLDLERAQGGVNPEGAPAAIADLFRAAHSLKGAARAVSIEMLEVAAHDLESIFADVRDGTATLRPDLFQLLFATVDAIRDAGRRLRAETGLDDGPLAALLPRLRAGADSLGPTVVPRLPPAAPPSDAWPPAGAASAWPSAAEPSAAEPSSMAPPPVPARPAQAASDREVPVRAGSVRVASARLDRMLALSGELLVARRRGEGRQAEIDRLCDAARQWEAEWRDAAGARRGPRQWRRDADTDAAVESGAAPDGRAPAAAILERNGEKLQWLTRQLDDLAARLAADRRMLEQVAAPLEAEVRQARMMPFAEACEGFQRMVRDLAREEGKEAGLVIEGGEIEIDRSVAEAVKDPLSHLLRNAVGHGIETPAVRAAAGKPARGRITIGAALRSGGVEFVVADDGGGFDLAAIREQARAHHLPVPATTEDATRLAFTPGFSTSAAVTALSGRGVGLDVVKTTIEARRGRIEVRARAGAGTRFILGMPISLTVLPALLVAAGGQVYALDSAAVHSLVRVGPEGLSTIEGRDVLIRDGHPVPVLALTDILGQPTHEPPHGGGKVSIVVLDAGAGQAAFTVDELLAEQDVLIQDLGPRLRRVRNVIGGTMLPTGKVAMILHAGDLVRDALGRAPSQTLSAALAERPAEARRRLLVVDDSVTTRTLMKSILETAGYDVATAADGMEAWRILQETGADLVVSDVEMPRMDGFALTEAIRASKRLRNLPVVLVTALETEPDRLRGLEAGADAYLRKSAFDQSDLIQAITQML